MSNEEQLKLFVFKRALRAIATLGAEALAAIAGDIPAAKPAAKSASVAPSQTEGAAGDAAAPPDSEVPPPAKPSAGDAIAEFTRAAVTRVTGVNLDSLPGPWLVVLGRLVGLPVLADRTAKPPGKAKLLSFLWGHFYETEPPQRREQQAPKWMTLELQLEQQRKDAAAKKDAAAAALKAKRKAARAAEMAQRRAERAAAKAAAKAARPKQPRPAARMADGATSESEASSEELEEDVEETESDDDAELAVVDTRVLKQRPAAAPKALAVAPPPELTMKVAAVVQALTMTTEPVLHERLRKMPGFEATARPAVAAAVEQLRAQDVVAVEHGVIYPLL